MKASAWVSHDFLNVFNRLLSLLTLSSLDEILQKIVPVAQEIMVSTSCSIYLVPDLLPKFDDVLIRNGEHIAFSSIPEHIVVLAASNREDVRELINKAYYASGEGVTGWIFEKNQRLNIKDLDDGEELAQWSGLKWSDAYQASSGTCEENEKKSMLAVPLRIGERTVGVIKFSGRHNKKPFTDQDELYASLIAQVVSTAIDHAAELTRRNKVIVDLTGLESKKGLDEILLEIDRGIKRIFRCENSQIYIGDTENSTLGLKAGKGNKEYVRGQGYIGWVYKTGKPMLIDDVDVFSKACQLDDETLQGISDNASINEEDRDWKGWNEQYFKKNSNKVCLIAVPIKQDGETLGVLSAQSRYGNSYSRMIPFNKADLEQFNQFAKIISRAIETEQEQLLNNLWMEMWYKTDPRELFSTVINKIPKMVSSAGCSVYELVKDIRGNYLQLTKSSREGLLENGEPVKLRFPLGEGKTGFCGRAGAVLVFNHFGVGEISEINMENELARIKKDYKDDLVERLKDEDGYQVGIIQLWKGKTTPRPIQDLFKSLPTEHTIKGGHLTSKKVDMLLGNRVVPISSFAAIPIMDKNELFGVITVSRSIPQNPFSSHDIWILEKIASRLAVAISTLTLQEQRAELFTSLAHEITTPLTGVLAESENMVEDLEGQHSLQLQARGMLERVQRLQLLTKTILGVLSSRTMEREFRYVNIGDVLRKAHNLFAAEAEQKGCKIREPQSVGDDFPKIAMSEMDLTIALQNIVHNAVKYSFYSTQSQDTPRFIKLFGKFVEPRSTNKYQIVVQNYGVGISKEEIDNGIIFEPFKRGSNATDRSRTGAGFGLANARKIIVELHNGSIDVSSEPKVGGAYLTTFTITLPIHR